ncbi:hypothetical protein PTSG_11073 [Salpingoeca rosetta]|uniref:Uncharacterized protein n=1 Tax=Salpingoeca rosetta (strain ATCC 50818 / BSB-021) TaxID=946362 RepID=F2US23_SALR5|nr:uncharacterized protein PTSG_11073 [Salpingoeca rosetta]EGD80428.1 hypothetical protein PTSG_11073 [Salpingoeca rosetta]|eukprot:XP_004987992.1 hypothetical protein PTSG_11073 [Salpingoeca rosetta]
MSSLPVRVRRQDALMEAACAGDLDTVTTLLLAGTDPNTANKVNGWTPLHWAAKRGHKAVVECLLQNGADPQRTNKDGKTPADIVHQSCAALFGVDPDEQQEKQTGPDADKPGFVPSYLKYPEFFYARAPKLPTAQTDTQQRGQDDKGGTEQEKGDGMNTAAPQGMPHTEQPNVSTPPPEMTADNTFFDVALVHERLTISAVAVPGTTLIKDIMTQLYPKATGAPEHIYADKAAGIRLLPSQTVFEAFRGLALRQQLMAAHRKQLEKEQALQLQQQEQSGGDHIAQYQQQLSQHQQLTEQQSVFTQDLGQLREPLHTRTGHYAQLAIFV